jgi:hypothetical protein
MISRMLCDPGDFDEGDISPPLLLVGNTWWSVRQRLLAALGPRPANSVLIQVHGPEVPYFPRPVGGAPIHKYWDTLTGLWVSEENDTETASSGSITKRPRGATPKGKILYGMNQEHGSTK